jgi:small GTP-binding protein
MPQEFEFDVFVSYSRKDEAAVLDLAQRLANEGVRVWLDQWAIQIGDSIPAKIEYGLMHSRLLLLCISAHALGADWVTLESHSFRFRDPLNQERRMIPVRLDDAEIHGSLAQFRALDWQSKTKDTFAQLCGLCLAQVAPPPAKAKLPEDNSVIELPDEGALLAAAFSADGHLLLRGGQDGMLELWQMPQQQRLQVFDGHKEHVFAVALSENGQYALSGSDDKTVRLWRTNDGTCLHVLRGHTNHVRSVAFSPDARLLLSASRDKTLRLWDSSSGEALRVFTGHTSSVPIAVFSADGRFALSGSWDSTLRWWDAGSGTCLRVFNGHTDFVKAVVLSTDGKLVLSGADDHTVRLWDVASGTCVRIFEGHTAFVNSVALSSDCRFAASGSRDQTVRLWDTITGACLRTVQGSDTIHHVAFSADQSTLFTASISSKISHLPLANLLPQATPAPPPASELEYTNAKVLIIGDSHAGKTGLTERLACDTFTPSASTAGAWATQWSINVSTPANITNPCQREIWLWDFGGQADQRLIHQLFMDQAALILLVFNADNEDVLPGLQEWQTALHRSLPTPPPQLLVAGRTDVGFKASRARLQAFAAEHGFGYFETSAKSGSGCPELRAAIIASIDWDKIPRRTSPLIFKQIKDVILQLRDEKQVLHTFKELQAILEKRLPPGAHFDTPILQTVISLLDGPGVIKQLDYGSYVLLQPEWINAYAQAVIRTLRADERELGALPLGAIAEGKLIFQSLAHNGSDQIQMQRLPQEMERIVLREMEKQLEERFICLRQDGKLIFPSHCGRERPLAPTLPSATHSYRVQGYLDDIYATLVVKLAQNAAFTIENLWRDAADFNALGQTKRMGLNLARDNSGSGTISVFFDQALSEREQIIFANYIHTHLHASCEQVTRQRNYLCAHCGELKNSSPALLKKLERDGEQAHAACDNCDKPIKLWDEQEQLFASEEVRERVAQMQAQDAIQLSAMRKGKLLTLEVAARIASCDHKSYEIPQTEDEGIDMVLEFTERDGRGSGKKLYLQLKSGNTHLKRRKDGTEIFQIKKAAWVDYWLKQPGPVMLVIGTFIEDERNRYKEGSGKLEFDEVRWMEISSILQQAQAQGKRPTQIEFKGERMDMVNIQAWRNRLLKL